MLSSLKKEIEDLLLSSVEKPEEVSMDSALIRLERPKEKIHGDFSCSAALRLSKILKKSPKLIAEQIAETFQNKIEELSLKAKIRRIEVKPPGFINFFLSREAFFDALTDILEQRSDYGRLNQGQGMKIQIEFVSANPTGPLTVAHARQAAVGDTLANILQFLGYEVQKEYYINDEGNQIRILGESICLRAQEILGSEIDFPEDHYQGAYIQQIAKELIEKKNIKTFEDVTSLSSKVFEDFGVRYLLQEIKQDLYDFHVDFDVWTSQKEVATQENIGSALALVEEKGYLYKKDHALWFQTTAFGDDKDRVVKKSDGQYTYFAPDIAYHKDKFDRGFDKVIDVLGPDHHGYILRLKAAAQALGRRAEDLDVLIIQLATLYRKGEPLAMSTRKGEFISLRQILKEVGADAARFFFLMRHINVHLDFDLELAKQESAENPVYYIQYAHARINSIFKKAKEKNLALKTQNFSRLEEPEEISLLQKMASLEDALCACLSQMDPYALTAYLMDLASAFHKFYDQHKVIQDDLALSSERLALIEAACIVFHNGLTLLGVDAPEQM